MITVPDISGNGHFIVSFTADIVGVPGIIVQRGGQPLVPPGGEIFHDVDFATAGARHIRILYVPDAVIRFHPKRSVRLAGFGHIDPGGEAAVSLGKTLCLHFEQRIALFFKPEYQISVLDLAPPGTLFRIEQLPHILIQRIEVIRKGGLF